MNYAEDAAADVDMNLVMTGKGRFVELQGTAERVPFAGTDLTRLVRLGTQGVRQLIALQAKALGASSISRL
jgi:ribonuclease PH